RAILRAPTFLYTRNAQARTNLAMTPVTVLGQGGVCPRATACCFVYPHSRSGYNSSGFPCLRMAVRDAASCLEIPAFPFPLGSEAPEPQFQRPQSAQVEGGDGRDDKPEDDRAFNAAQPPLLPGSSARAG